MQSSASCLTCELPIEPSWNFCPNCGSSLRYKPLSISVGKQILIYLVSFFFPPFGLGYAFKYLKQPDTKSKIIGSLAIVLTIVSIVLTIITFKTFADQYGTLLNNLSTGHYSY